MPDAPGFRHVRQEDDGADSDKANYHALKLGVLKVPDEAVADAGVTQWPPDNPHYLEPLGHRIGHV